METHLSDVARFRQKQALEEEAAQRGLTGLASVASHDYITARMQHSAEHLLKLLEEGKHTEVAQLMEQDMWGLEELAP